MTLVLSTRGSRLALWQAETTRDLLRAAHSDVGVEIHTVQSSGDRDQTSALERFGRIGIFTVEVDAAVLDGRAHVSVHSLKDMTTTLQDGLVLASVLARGPVEDVLISPSGRTLAELPAGARVATGSLRRGAMLRRLRPDLEVVGIRGNVETRIAKLEAGEADALVMARAGMERLGLERHVTEILGIDRLLPAVGQGIVGLVCRQSDAETRARLRAVADAAAWPAALAERAFLRALHGGCNVPAAAHARIVAGELALDARVLAVDGSEELADAERGPAEDAEAIGTRLAERLIAAGADRLVAAARA